MATNEELFNASMNNLANAINEKTGNSNSMTIGEMANAVRSISTGPNVDMDDYYTKEEIHELVEQYDNTIDERFDECLQNGDSKVNNEFVTKYKSFYFMSPNNNTRLYMSDTDFALANYSNGTAKVSLKDGDVKINEKSFNDLYNQVQSLIGDVVDYVEDTTNNIVKDIPSNVEPYAVLNTICGETHYVKSDNLIVIDNVANTTISGITYSVTNGVITINGTTTGVVGINLTLKRPIPAGTYMIKNFGSVLSSGNHVFGTCDSTDNMKIQHSFVSSDSKKATPTVETTKFRMYIYSGVEFTNFTLMPVIVEGTTMIPIYRKGFLSYYTDTKVNELQLVNNLFKPASTNVVSSTGVVEYQFNTNGWCYINKNNKTSSSISLMNNCNIPAGTYNFDIIFEDGVHKDVGYFCFVYDSATDRKTTRGYTSSESKYYTTPIVFEEPIVRIYTYLGQSVFVDKVKFLIILTDVNDTKNVFTISNNITSLEGYGVSIPNTDICNYVDLNTNKFVRKVATYTFTGDESINISTIADGVEVQGIISMFKGIAKASVNNDTVGAIYSDALPTVTVNEIYGGARGISISNNGTVCVHIPGKTTSALIKNYLIGTTIVYELQTPEYVSIEQEYDNILKVDEHQQIIVKSNNNRNVVTKIEYQTKGN